jgi:hypothetical protein
MQFMHTFDIKGPIFDKRLQMYTSQNLIQFERMGRRQDADDARGGTGGSGGGGVGVGHLEFCATTISYLHNNMIVFTRIS